jgi:hypothetical protein
MTKKPGTSTTTTQSARPAKAADDASAPDASGTSVASAPPPESAPTTGQVATSREPAEGSRKGDALQIVTRFPADLGARLDRYTESLRNERFGLRVSRADAVRILVHEALAAHEAGRESPPTLTHKGKTFQRTGKLGSNRASGLPSAEYEGEDGSRMWRDVNGSVRDE